MHFLTSTLSSGPRLNRDAKNLVGKREKKSDGKKGTDKKSTIYDYLKNYVNKIND